MHKLVHAWGQDRLDVESQLQSSYLALEVLMNTAVREQSSPSCKQRLAMHFIANFRTFSEKTDEKPETMIGLKYLTKLGCSCNL